MPVVAGPDLCSPPLPRKHPAHSGWTATYRSDRIQGQRSIVGRAYIGATASAVSEAAAISPNPAASAASVN